MGRRSRRNDSASRIPLVGIALTAAVALGAVPALPALHASPLRSEGAESSALVAHLAQASNEAGSTIATCPGWRELRAAFRGANPGYDLELYRSAESLVAAATTRVVFVQAGEARVTVGGVASDVACGDLVLLAPGAGLSASAPLDVLVFVLEATLPMAALPPGLPTFVRPDWDPAITDTPGGCATEEGAYRRILLTWLAEKGPYVWHGLNAHRVRIEDSFTHYHPQVGGFDEFYLVQGSRPEARLLTTDAVEAVEAREVTEDAAPRLFRETPLAVGDLVYLPRGTIHRGLGGVLAQVIAVPGFRPGTEIGVDAHLRAINAKLGLRGCGALPFHE